MTEDEYRLERIELAKKLKKLQADDLFKEVILDAYMRDMDILLHYDGSSDTKDRLIAIANLHQWMEDTVSEAEKIV